MTDKRIEKEKKRQEKYREYINYKIDSIAEEMNKQRKILLDNYVSVDECTNIILNKESRLWERKPEDKDFLHVRLGIGELPLDADIAYPEDKFFMEEDELRNIFNTVLIKSKTISGAPIVFPLAENKVTAIISENLERQPQKRNESEVS